MNQLRYEITLKDNLLKSFIDLEADGLWDEQNEIAQKKKLKWVIISNTNIKKFISYQLN